MPKEEAKDDSEKEVVTKIPITIKFSDDGNEEVQQEVVLEEPKSIAQGRTNVVSNPLQSPQIRTLYVIFVRFNVAYGLYDSICRHFPILGD
ncbi:hypothetical protein Q3G72_000914 [Acer saccharum]|nr:hypothetical protein Q3G72_000914 [Acer saccharum]